ncbi:MAG: putative replication protein A [Promethearchaeota archaeon]|jgi:replication factor A1|nr:MAG: putative replication protein A [Candidatus Lokiarchaeota archaeon]
MKTDIYIKKIIEETGLTKKKIEDLVNEKKQELKGLISDEGALFIIAKELGVDVKNQNNELIQDIEINVSDITSDMRNITLVGRIREIYRIFKFNRKDGSEGKVGSFLLHDKTGDIRVVLWDEQTDVFKSPGFDINELVKVINSYAKEGKYGVEIHIGRLGKIILSPEDVNYKNYPKITKEIIPIEEINLSQRSISTKGKVLRVAPINKFERKDGNEGRVGSLHLVDSTGSIRITFWNEDTEKLSEVKKGDNIKISNLNPRQSNFNKREIELFANSNSKILHTKEEIDLKGNFVEDIKSLQNMENIVSFKGIVSTVDNLKKVTLKSGEEVSLFSFVVSDETDGIRVTLWRDLAEKYSEKIENSQGVYLKNVLLRFSSFYKRKEISFIENSEIEFIDLKIDQIKEINTKNKREGSSNFTRNYSNIKEINSSGFFELKGVIVKEINSITVYDACSKCFKKVDNCQCEEIGEVEIRMILNIVIDDGTDTIRCTFIGENAEKLIGEKTEIVSKIVDSPDMDNFLDKVNQKILGKDILVRGKAKYSDFSNLYEVIVYDFKYLNINNELEHIINKIEI